MAKFAVYLEDWPAQAEPRLVRRLVQLTGKDERRVRRKLTRRPVRLAKSVDHEKVRRLKLYFEQLGAQLTVEPVDALESSLPKRPAPPGPNSHNVPSGVIPVTEAYSVHPSEIPDSSPGVEISRHGERPADTPQPLSLVARWQGALARLGDVFLLAFGVTLLLMLAGGLVIGGPLYLAGLTPGADVVAILRSPLLMVLLLVVVLLVSVLDGWWLTMLLQLSSRTLALGERPACARYWAMPGHAHRKP